MQARLKLPFRWKSFHPGSYTFAVEKPDIVVDKYLGGEVIMASKKASTDGFHASAPFLHRKSIIAYISSAANEYLMG